MLWLLVVWRYLLFCCGRLLLVVVLKFLGLFALQLLGCLVGVAVCLLFCEWGGLL